MSNLRLLNPKYVRLLVTTSCLKKHQRVSTSLFWSLNSLELYVDQRGSSFSVSKLKQPILRFLDLKTFFYITLKEENHNSSVVGLSPSSGVSCRIFVFLTSTLDLIVVTKCRREEGRREQLNLHRFPSPKLELGNTDKYCNLGHHQTTNVCRLHCINV